jgi:TonB family protein
MKMMATTRIGLALWLVTACATSLGSQTISTTTEIAKRLEKKTLFVRGFPDESQVIYDDQGKPLQAFKAGSWSYGQIFVEKVKFSDDKIEISGKRVGHSYDGHWKEKRTDHNQVLTVKVSPAELTAANAGKILDAIFVFDKGKVEQTQVGHWYKTDEQGNPLVTNKTRIQTVGSGVEAPKPIETSDPKGGQGSDKAQPKGRNEFQGKVLLWLVVTESGEVAVIQVRKPMGMGLDEKAIAGVQKWRFKPAKKDGKPVTVAFNLEVNFNLD